MKDHWDGQLRGFMHRAREGACGSVVDQKPDRNDKRMRIVIQWNGHRVSGILAMSRRVSYKELCSEFEIEFIASFITSSWQRLCGRWWGEEHVWGSGASKLAELLLIQPTTLRRRSVPSLMVCNPSKARFCLSVVMLTADREFEGVGEWENILMEHLRLASFENILYL